MTHTKGTWKIGKQSSTVITDGEHPVNKDNNKESSKNYYGGALICESILNPADAKLITEAPALLRALDEIVRAFMDNKKENGVTAIAIDEPWIKELEKTIEKAS